MANSSSQPSPGQIDEKIAISRAEVILLVLLVVVGMGIWVWVDREVTELIKDKEPREDNIQAKFQVPTHQNEVLRAQNERKAIEEQLIQSRLEQSKQSATTKALSDAYPELAKDAATAPKSIPIEIVQNYRDAHIKEMIATQLITSLTERLEAVKTQEANVATILEMNKRSASSEFHRSQALYLLAKPALTLAASLIIMLLLIFIVRWFVSPRAGRRFTVQNPLMFLLVIGVLFVLFAYQAFEMAGAALVGVVVVLILFAYILGPQKASTVTKLNQETTVKK